MREVRSIVVNALKLALEFQLAHQALMTRGDSVCADLRDGLAVADHLVEDDVVAIETPLQRLIKRRVGDMNRGDQIDMRVARTDVAVDRDLKLATAVAVFDVANEVARRGRRRGGRRACERRRAEANDD